MNAAGVLLVTIATVCGFFLLFLLALVIGGIAGMGWWLTPIPFVLGALFLAARRRRVNGGQSALGR